MVETTPRSIGSRTGPSRRATGCNRTATRSCSCSPSSSSPRVGTQLGAARPVFAELLAHEGVEELCELRSPFGFMAFHGGNLEHGTDQVALEAAARAGASFYGVL